MIITVAVEKAALKTTFAVNLAYALAKREQRNQRAIKRRFACWTAMSRSPMIIFCSPDFRGGFVKVPKPVWDVRMPACGKCAEVCNYNAIAMVKKNVLIFNELCHSAAPAHGFAQTGR